MASVTFPTNLGGSGQTISDDADPNTGLANGGHRLRFVPALQGSVDMAQYVYRYAAKIDNAAEDAQRAEDARAYVESVADSYEANILDGYRNKWALDLDFSRGRYGADDGTLTETTNPADLLTATRSAPKWVEGPDGLLREVPIDTVAREWRNGEPWGLIYESTSTNIALKSTMDSSPWVTERLSRTDVTMLSFGGSVKPVSVYIPSTDDNEHFYYQSSIAVDPGETYTQSIWVPKQRAFNPRFIYRSDGSPPDNSGTPPSKIDERNGWERLAYTFENPSDSTIIQLRIYLYQGNDLSYPGDGATGLPVDEIQLEKGPTASSNITTGSVSPVTRNRDVLYKSDLGGFSAHKGITVYGSFKLNGNRANADTASGIVSLYDATGATSEHSGIFVRNDAGPKGRIRFHSSMMIDVGDTISDPYDRNWHSFAISMRDGLQVIRVDGSEIIYHENLDPEKFFSTTQGLGLFSYVDSNISRPPGSANMKKLTVIPFAFTAAECSEIVTALQGGN